MSTNTQTNDRGELDALRQLPPEAVAGLLGLNHDQAAQRQHGGSGYSYWRTPAGELITIRQGRAGWVWHPTQRGGGGGGDWLALYQHINPGANLGHARRALRQALAGAGGHARASQPLLAPRAATIVIEPPKPLELCEPPAWAVDYLQRERGIPISTINHAARHRVMAGHRPGYRPDPSAVHLAFPHTTREGIISHAELRGPEGSGDGGTGRSKRASRGRKGLWILPAQEETRTMVVTEGAIKGLACSARLAQADKHAWIVSTGGDPGQAQLQQLAWLAEELGIDTLVLAQDSDQAGNQQAAKCKCAAVLSAPIKTPRFAPPGGFVGWDDWAMAQRG
uniref:Toprim domain-containing protein n=1 Tax=mine drainage metagenome TaxID=410659 RepID=E6PSI3_9ZZZZ